MENTIREMKPQDQHCVLEMMRVFYASPAVLSNGSEEIFLNDFSNCIYNKQYLEGYIFENAEAIQGYAMVAKSFSTEFGKLCIWVEDLFIKEAYRGRGIGKAFLDYITQKYADCVIRLEVEEENETAVKLYQKCGFTQLPYMQMKK